MVKHMDEIRPIKLSHEDIDRLSKISDLLIRMYEKERKLFDNELLGTFYGSILSMTDEMDGTGLIAVKHIKSMKDFVEK